MRAAASREDVRERILDSTDRLLARYGYTKLTMDDLAREAGIGKGTIYLHFPAKEEVVLSHIDRIVEAVKHELRAIAAADEPHAMRIRRMLCARVLVRFDSVQGYTESLDDLLAAIRPSLLQRRRRHFEDEAVLLAGVLADGTRTGALHAPESLETGRALVLATNGLLPYSLSRRELGKRAEVEARIEGLADLFLTGLVSRTEPPRLARRRQ
jgi:AcrR family transcriptional regulator